jgi:ABC-type multidrug transport system ATPase subunit
MWAPSTDEPWDQIDRENLTRPGLTRGLGKRYRRTWALRDCDLTVPAGQVTALVEPNSAGKTTLLRILAGLVTPTAGTAAVLGAAPGSAQARAIVSAVHQPVPLYRHLRVADQLAAARALNDQWDAPPQKSSPVPANRPWAPATRKT